MSTKNRIRSGARAGKSNTPQCPSPSDFETLKPTPFKITHQELHEKVSKAVSSAIEPLKSYKDFLDYKLKLSEIKTEIHHIETHLEATRDRRAELERAVADFAKTLQTEALEALR